MPFLRFYYDTFPAVDDGLAGAAEVASLVRNRGKVFNGLVWMGCDFFAAALLWGGCLLEAGH